MGIKLTKSTHTHGSSLFFACCLGIALPVLPGCASTPAGGDALPDVSAQTTSGDASGSTFTAAQATAGEETYSVVCSECHSASEFRGTDFRYRFRRRSAWNLFTVLSETMPEDAPGSLSPEGYVDVVSYILQLNGYEPGPTALTATQAALSQLPLDSVPTGPPNS